jgi:hypothetical protein
MAQLTATQGSAVTPARWRRVLAPGATIGGLALASLALHLRDPHESGSWGACPSAAMGVYCPGCGGLRAVNDLTRGDLAAAASSNLVLVVLLPFAVLGLGLWLADRWRGDTRSLPPGWVRPLVVAGAVVLVVFTVLRNLPGSWLAP